MKAKQHWMDKVMDSVDDIQPAPVDPSLHAAIMNRLKNAQTIPVVLKIQFRTIWRVAACISFLVLLNVLAVIHYSRTSRAYSSTEHSNPVTNEYFSFLNTPQF